MCSKPVSTTNLDPEVELFCQECGKDLTELDCVCNTFVYHPHQGYTVRYNPGDHALYSVRQLHNLTKSIVIRRVIHTFDITRKYNYDLFAPISSGGGNV